MPPKIIRRFSAPIGPRDRHIYLTLIDSAIMAQECADNKSQEAESLYTMMLAANAKMDHELVRIISQKHSKALHRSSEFKGQNSAYLAIVKYMGRIGYKFV